MANQKRRLSWDVFVTAPEPTTNPDFAPGLRETPWSPIASTLISGETDAVLVDPVMTVGQAHELADWVDSHNKSLTKVYVTHGHPDHWYGLSVILERFPAAQPVALPAVVHRMREASTPTARAVADFLLPGKIARNLPIAEPLSEGRIELEGQDLLAIQLGHTDGDDTTALHVPDIGLVVAGDAVYNDVHQYLAESNHEGRLAWLAALDTIAALRPKTVIAGHQRAGRPDGPEILEETRRYLLDFDRIAELTQTHLELYERMLELYPTRLNPGVLWFAARTLKPAEPVTMA